MNSDNGSLRTSDISLSQSAIIAGAGLLIMAILAPIANFAVLQNLVVADDPAGTVSNIVESEGLFRLGICFFLVVALLDILVAWALYIFLKPVNRSLSLLTAWLRVVYATMLAVVIIYLLDVLQLLSGADYLSSLTPAQTQTQVMIALHTFNLGWSFGLIVFGFHLLLLGSLMIKAGYMHKILGILLLLAASGYLIDGFGKVLSASYSLNISMFTFIGEIVLIFWLLIRGRKVRVG